MESLNRTDPAPSGGTLVGSYVASNGATYTKKVASCPEKLYVKRVKSGHYLLDGEQLLKRCAKCREHWPADTEFFYATAGKPDGLYSWCKACYTSWRYPNRQKN